MGWNVAGVVVLALAALSARSVALAGFGLDSLVEIGASTVVLWELVETGEARQRRALRMIGVGFVGFVGLSLYIAVQPPSSCSVASARSTAHWASRGRP